MKNAGKITLAVVGGVGTLLAVGLMAAGGLALWANAAKTDGGGYFATGAHPVATTSHALVATNFELDSGAGWLLDEEDLVRLRVTSSAIEPETPVFVGVGREADVAAYLDGVAWDEVTDFETAPFAVETELHAGTLTPGAPAAQPIWAATAQGTGEQTLDWAAEPGEWSIVVMNADGSASVATSTAVGAKVPLVFDVGLGLAIGGGVLMAGSIMLLVLGLRPRRKPPAADPVPLSA
jgi:hypothetical protein